MDKLTALWEIEQIKKLKARYFRLMDAKQWGEYRKLFADDMRFYKETAEADRPITRQGADEFVHYVSLVTLPTAVTAHHGHMPEIELTSETTAIGIWAMYDWVDDPDHGRAFKGLGYYHEDYEKGEDGQWRIKTLRLSRIRVDACAYTELVNISRSTATVQGE